MGLGACGFLGESHKGVGQWDGKAENLTKGAFRVGATVGRRGSVCRRGSEIETECTSWLSHWQVRTQGPTHQPLFLSCGELLLVVIFLAYWPTMLLWPEKHRGLRRKAITVNGNSPLELVGSPGWAKGIGEDAHGIHASPTLPPKSNSLFYNSTGWFRHSFGRKKMQ